MTTAIKAEGSANFLSGLLSQAKIKNKLSSPINAAPVSNFWITVSGVAVQTSFHEKSVNPNKYGSCVTIRMAPMAASNPKMTLFGIKLAKKPNLNTPNRICKIPANTIHNKKAA